jgi:hypothetical protein
MGSTAATSSFVRSEAHFLPSRKSVFRESLRRDDRPKPWLLFTVTTAGWRAHELPASLNASVAWSGKKGLHDGLTCLNPALSKRKAKCDASRNSQHTILKREKGCPRCTFVVDGRAWRFNASWSMAGRGLRLSNAEKLGLMSENRLQNIHELSVPPLPCSRSRQDDSVIIASFFADSIGNLLPSPDATFLEIGGADGFHASNTWYLERCLGWRGILVEGQPQSFHQMVNNRPATLNLGVAACSSHGTVAFSSQNLKGNASSAAAGTLSKARAIEGVTSSSGMRVPCGPMGEYLAALNIGRIDFFSLDVCAFDPLPSEFALQQLPSNRMQASDALSDGHRWKDLSSLSSSR